MWTEPDPALEPVAHLDEGVQVELSVLRGSWAEVICANEFRAWVDAGRLVPLVPSTAPVAVAPAVTPQARARTSRRNVWIAVGAVAALILVVVLVAGRGGGDKKNTASSTAGSGSSVVRMHVPAGWSVQDHGDTITVAKDKADLDRDLPQGPRVVASVQHSSGNVVDLMSTVFDSSSDGSIVEAPTETQVSGVGALSVGIQQNGITQRLIYTHPQGKDAVVFRLEAPAAAFSGAEADLASVPGLAV